MNFKEWWDINKPESTYPAMIPIVKAMREIAERAFDAGVEEGWDRAEAWHQIDKG